MSLVELACVSSVLFGLIALNIAFAAKVRARDRGSR
jgi:hypothetical protein